MVVNIHKPRGDKLIFHCHNFLCTFQSLQSSLSLQKHRRVLPRIVPEEKLQFAHKCTKERPSLKASGPWRSTEGTVIWERDWTLRPEAKRILGKRLRWQERLRILEKTPADERVCEFVGNFLTLYWRIKMFSSALRVGFSRVSMATKRCLVPTINAGIFVIVLDHTFRSSKTFVHVELVVRGYCGYTQGV